MRKINEIFYSLQGEGAHTGCPSVFVRFSGCNKRCFFCDTEHQSGVEMTDEQIIDEVNRYPARWIVLTGGEPSLWIDSEFICRLKRDTDKMIAIETNGSLPIPAEIDWITVSPKSGMAGAGDYDLLVARADELKVVDVGQSLEDYFNLECVTPQTRMFLQPCFTDNEEECRKNIERTISKVLEDPRWTLSLQTHRFLGIR